MTMHFGYWFWHKASNGFDLLKTLSIVPKEFRSISREILNSALKFIKCNTDINYLILV